MRQQVTAWALGGLLAATGTAWAQGAEKKEESHGTVKKEDVKTWTMTEDGKEYEVRPATPTYGGDTGLFHLSSAYTLPKGKASFSLFRDNLDRDPKDIDASILGLSLAFGATSRLEIFGSIGLQNRIDADALFQPGFVAEFPNVSTAWQTGVGDVKLGAKFKLLDDYKNDPLGLAIRGFVKVPTADETKGLGTGKLSAGGELVLSKSLGDVADIHGSIGFQFNGTTDAVSTVNGINLPSRKLGTALRWGAGINIPTCKIVQLQAEVTGLKYSGVDGPDQTNPVDVVIGPVVWIKPGIFIRPALSWNANFDDRGLGSSFKSYAGRQISIGYHPGTPCREIYVPPAPQPPRANRPPTVSCNPEKSQVIPGETVRCRATASDPDGDPLTYSWTASSGRVTGTGAEATFDSSGVAAPGSATITVTVSDGRGGTASATCTIRVERPAAPRPEPVKCTSGGFPRNLSRLNNVDKACLDDVASRLRQDPRGRVVIVGHADSQERYPEVIGRKRAEDVKAYLVKERGIDESRISTRSVGATQPLDTGTSAAARAKNRRVDVYYVPEGATVPEDDD